MIRQFECGTKGPIVEPSLGRLRGFRLESSYIFQGIRYATAKRFQAPVPEGPWEGVRDALWYGHVCPLLDPNSPAMDLLIPHRFWPESEDCLSLNVWSQCLDRDAKKPVMVWLHGGGYATGSSIEMVAYDGANMSRFGDCVVVTLNHRLNILGYFDLSSYGERFENSGNAGQADIVAALKWVRANIAAFGGDPNNVTLFGQSGGGGKIVSLMQTPAADGLFHKGILMSGGAGAPMFRAERRDREIAELLIAELGGEDVSVLETVPFAKLSEAFHAIGPALREKGIVAQWAPLANDWYLGDPWDVGWTNHAKTVPLMAGTVIAEWGFAGNVPDKDEIAPEKRREILAEQYGEHTDELIEAFKAAYPGKNELILKTMANRLDILEFCRRRDEAGCAGTWNYLFTYDFPYDGGMPAWHCSDIPYAFHNIDKVAICNGNLKSEDLQRAYFGAYMQFARTGSPNGYDLKEWPPYTAAYPATMFFDEESGARVNADATLHRLHKPLTPDPFEAMRKRREEEEEKLTF